MSQSKSCRAPSRAMRQEPRESSVAVGLNTRGLDLEGISHQLAEGMLQVSSESGFVYFYISSFANPGAGAKWCLCGDFFFFLKLCPAISSDQCLLHFDITGLTAAAKTTCRGFSAETSKETINNRLRFMCTDVYVHTMQIHHLYSVWQCNNSRFGCKWMHKSTDTINVWSAIEIKIHFHCKNQSIWLAIHI